jgi:hypothetical protein
MVARVFSALRALDVYIGIGFVVDIFLDIRLGRE